MPAIYKCKFHEKKQRKFASYTIEKHPVSDINYLLLKNYRYTFCHIMEEAVAVFFFFSCRNHTRMFIAHRDVIRQANMYVGDDTWWH